VVLAAVAAGLASVLPLTPLLVGVLVSVVGVAAAGRFQARAGSRWHRGWWVVAAAAPLIGLGATPWADARGGLAPIAGAVGASLLLVGLVGSRPVRDHAQTRELLVRALLTGLAATYLVAVLLSAVEVTAGVGVLIALAAEVAALTVTVHRVLVDRPIVAGVDGPLVASLTLLVLTRLAGLLEVSGGPAVVPDLLAVGTTAALVLLAVPLGGPQVSERVPAALASDRVLRTGHLLLVILAVLAGPVAVTLRGAWRADASLLETAVPGALLALFSVLHLAQLVRDHGHRAWRARHDALTTLPTEPLFRDRLEQEIMRARRTGRGLAVAFIDLDGFKRVNDRDGHEAGDQVLRTVAQRLQGALRGQDTVARKSGDEFLVLLPEVEGAAAAEVVAAKLVAAISEPVQLPAGVHHVGASVGLALWPRDGETADELVRNADVAMYDVKEDQGGAVRWYTRATTSRTRLRLTLAAQLELALDDPDQFDVAYQPRVDLRDGRVEGLVALVRWHHPELGLITPRSFLPIAAEAGLSRLIDLAMLERTAGDLVRWRSAGWLDVPITVHLADQHVAHPHLADDVVAILRATGLPGDRLQLAVTETGLGRGGARTLTSIRELGASGVTTLVSRFGTGSISLGMLAAADVATVELASEHVAPVHGRNSPVIRAALAVAQELELVPVVNGVTTLDQIERLREAGCRAGRGPYLGAPQLAEVFERRLGELATRPEHRASVVLASELTPAEGGAQAERPGVAAVLAAAAGLDDELEERTLLEVLALIGPTGEPEQQRPAPVRVQSRRQRSP
jgi:diguanylate cyclase (GGDEF)-like protein